MKRIRKGLPYHTSVMSLNGLNTPEVQEAYQSAIAEAGGWCVKREESATTCMEDNED